MAALPAPIRRWASHPSFTSAAARAQAFSASAGRPRAKSRRACSQDAVYWPAIRSAAISVAKLFPTRGGPAAACSAAISTGGAILASSILREQRWFGAVYKCKRQPGSPVGVPETGISRRRSGTKSEAVATLLPFSQRKTVAPCRRPGVGACYRTGGERSNPLRQRDSTPQVSATMISSRSGPTPCNKRGQGALTREGFVWMSTPTPGPCPGGQGPGVRSNPPPVGTIMIIGINAQKLYHSQDYRNAGISRYIGQLLSHLGPQTKHRFIVFTNEQLRHWEGWGEERMAPACLHLAHEPGRRYECSGSSWCCPGRPGVTASTCCTAR